MIIHGEFPVCRQGRHVTRKIYSELAELIKK